MRPNKFILKTKKYYNSAKVRRIQSKLWIVFTILSRKYLLDFSNSHCNWGMDARVREARIGKVTAWRTCEQSRYISCTMLSVYTSPFGR